MTKRKVYAVTFVNCGCEGITDERGWNAGFAVIVKIDFIYEFYFIFAQRDL